MDVYRSEHTVSPMTDTGEASDAEKETDLDPIYNGSNMELKIQASENEDSAVQRQADEELESPVPATHASQSSMPSNEVANDTSSSLPINEYTNHSLNLPIGIQENGHPHAHEIISKNSSVYDFNDSTSVSEESHNEMPLGNGPMNDSSLGRRNSEECDRIRNDSLDNIRPGQEIDDNRPPISHSVSEFSGHNHNQSHSGQLSHINQSHHPNYQTHDLPHTQPHSVPHNIQGINQQPPGHLQRLNAHSHNSDQNIPMDMGGQSYNATNDSYDDSLSVVSEYSNSGNSYDGIGIIRRARGRPRGSKNGTGMGRARGRGYKMVDDRTSCASYDLRNVSDPFSCQRRGRPRSRFIVDLGEQNHEAWTKSKEELNISDAELTTLLLSLLESRKDNKESADSETMMSLASSEFKKWKEKFASQISLLTHYASIHNTTCCTCLGIKKKKYIPAGTGKRGRPRKYPPPVGYDTMLMAHREDEPKLFVKQFEEVCDRRLLKVHGDGPGMQRPDTIDEDGNIFEPQIILKDGMVVKNEPSDKDLAVGIGNVGSSNGDPQSNQQHNSQDMQSLNGDPFGQYLSRPLTQEEIEKRREYYNNHKNKIKYVCHFCQIHFYHKPNFDYHISKLESTGKCKVFDKVNNLYLCESCGEGFSWREKLEKHLRLAEQHGTHNQKELLMYGDFQCNMCGKTFNKRTTYLQHVKWHEEREDIPCVICGTMFKQTELRHHLMDIHSNDSLPCSYCGKLFTSRKYLEKHELIHQGGNFPCPECGKIFTQKCNMQAHLQTHALDKEYPCETCGQMFNQRIGLCHHLKKHFPPSEFNYECELCAHYFSNDYLMKYHKKKIHNIPIDGIPDDISDQPDYLSSPMSSHMSGDDEREKAYGTANSVVKNMLSASLGGSLGGSVNLTMKHEGGSEPMEDGQNSLRDSVHMNEHMRHMAEHRDTPGHLKDPMDQDDSMRMNEHHMQVNDDHLHMPQDLTRMTASQAHMNDSSDRMPAAPQAHMNDLRSSSTDSPGRLSDTPAHMSDNLGRMSAVENFGRMTGTPGGYLAEHIRRMAENQSRMSDSMSHYDDRDNYSRLGENLRSMSRGSAGDPMGRLGDNLSHMGVIRPSQGPSGTSQWPPHMQNHSALEGMNQSPQTSQHTLYPLPFWPYDPSLRQYHH